MLEEVRNYQLKHKELKLVPITTDNYWEIGWLELDKKQEKYVGDNFKSMAYAYATVMEGKYAKAFGIYFTSVYCYLYVLLNLIMK